MSKGKSAIDDHTITITHRPGSSLFWWNCGCGKRGSSWSNPQATSDAYSHVKWVLYPRAESA